MSDAHEPADVVPEDVSSEERILDTTTATKGFTITDAPPDPLDHLVERAKDDPGLPFTGPIRAALMELRRADRAAFETLRSRLKSIGVRVTSLDGAMAAETGSDERRQSHADLLIEIAGDAELFHASDMTPLADVTIEGHRETWPVRSRGFRRWLSSCLLSTTRRRAERRGGAGRAGSDRGQGPLRCPGAADLPANWRARRQALPRLVRSRMARGGDRQHRLASGERSTVPISPCRRDAAAAGADTRRLGRRPAPIPECRQPCGRCGRCGRSPRFRFSGGVVARRVPRDWPIPRSDTCRRTRQREIDLPIDPPADD